MGQLKCMKRHGMYIGGHGFDHVRLDYLKPKEQELEINKTLDLLKKVGTNTNHWTICYPHGSYNQSLIKLLQANGCRVGIGTKVGIANLFEDSPYALPRLNTNDLPK
jgi:peptidoglycan/xylan/chitin deacetylase (PgdA/CDA1 family)